MAGDWLKVRVDLHDDPAVIGIAALLGINEDEAVGKLIRVWAWANRQSRDGHAPSVTGAWLDRYVQRDGFATAMQKVGWLDINAAGLTIPRFDRHNGATAKERILSAQRSATYRAAKTSRSDRDATVTREEKSREEKSKEEETPPTPQGGSAFDSFWQAYPRKTAKQHALKAWRRIAPDEALCATILAALERHKASEQWQRNVIPHPATWLNGRRWEDETLGAGANGRNGRPDPGAPAETPLERAARLEREREARAVPPGARASPDEIRARLESARGRRE